MARLHGVFILLLWAVPVALAEERILSFHSEIIVEKNGDLLVTVKYSKHLPNFLISLQPV